MSETLINLIARVTNDPAERLVLAALITREISKEIAASVTRTASGLPTNHAEWRGEK